MNKDCIIYKRGQVWFRKQSYQSKYTKGLQQNSRPVLIISSDEGNATNSTVTVLKITSQERKTRLSINVSVYNENEEENVILCNQIETIPKFELEKYLYTLSSSKMKEVEKAVLQANGMSVYSNSIQDQIDEVYKVLSRLESMKAHEYSPDVKRDEEIAKNTAQKMLELVKDLQNYYNRTAEEVKKNIDHLDDYRARTELGVNINKNDSSEESPSVVNKSANKPKKRNRWTKETMEEFLTDKEKLKPSEFAEKYGFSSVQKAMFSYYNIKYKYRDAYGEFKVN